MGNRNKISTGTQYVDPKDDSTQTIEAPDIDYFDLLNLANMFLHSSYWFLMLSITLTRLDLTGLAWAAKQKDTICRESAMTILSWVMEKGGRMRMVDIVKPDYGKEEDFTAEYAVRIMANLDTWLVQGVREEMEMVVGKEIEGIEEVLRSVLDKHRGFYWDSQALKNRVFSAE